MARVLSLEHLDEEAREALLGALPLLGQALDRLREFLEQPEAPVLATIATIKTLEGAGWMGPALRVVGPAGLPPPLTLRRASEVLRKASAVFAQAELDRKRR